MTIEKKLDEVHRLLGEIRALQRSQESEERKRRQEEGEGLLLGPIWARTMLKWWKWQARWRVKWRPVPLDSERPEGLECSDCGLEWVKDPDGFSKNTWGRNKDRLAEGVRRKEKPIVCVKCTEVRKMKEEEVDSWIASLRVVACKGCKKTLAAAELSVSQLNKSVHRRRCVWPALPNTLQNKIRPGGKRQAVGYRAYLWSAKELSELLDGHAEDLLGLGVDSEGRRPVRQDIVYLSLAKPRLVVLPSRFRP